MAYSCAVELAVDTLGGKWKTVLLAHLKEGDLRYVELKRLVPALSDKMLTQRLRDLVALGLVQRRRERYRLTERGRSLTPVLEALYAWGKRIAEEDGVALAPTPRVAERHRDAGRSSARGR